MAHGQGGAEIGFDRGQTLTCNHEAPIAAYTEPYTLAIRGRGDTHNLEYRQDGTANALLTPNGGRGGIGVGAIAFDTTQITSAANYSNPQPGDPCHPLAAGAHAPAIAFHPTQDPISSTDGSTHALGCGSTGGQASVAVAVALRGSAHRTYAVRRLTVEECELLQGFPRGYTRIPWRGKPADQCPDGPRYKALGNSWAVPVVRWIGERINAVEQIKHEMKAA
jgi:DNA (cytosine-5)-methyltransferase 1